MWGVSKTSTDPSGVVFQLQCWVVQTHLAQLIQSLPMSKQDTHAYIPLKFALHSQHLSIINVNESWVQHFSETCFVPFNTVSLDLFHWSKVFTKLGLFITRKYCPCVHGNIRTRHRGEMKVLSFELCGNFKNNCDLKRQEQSKRSTANAHSMYFQKAFGKSMQQ